MVLSPKVAKPPEHGRPPNQSTRSMRSNSSTSPKTTVLYSKVHQRPAVTRESLLHRHSHVPSQPSSDSVDLNTTDSNNVKPVIIDTTFWGVSQSSGSIFFDVTSRRESDRELYKVAFYQLKDYVGLVVHKSGPNRYLEVNFDNEEFRTSACHEGLKFDNGLVIIRPVIACRPGSIIKRVTLQRLSWLRPQRLLEGLRSTLGNYGVVRDVGIVTDTETGAFLGSGYAVLDCSPDPTQTDPFLELTHAIEWVNTSDSAELSSVFIHAYWKDMPTYCKYCHELGHSAIQCKDAPSNKRICFYCFKPGHIRAQCPDKVALGKRRKGNHSPSVSHELDPPVNTVTTDNTASDTTALEVFNTEVSQYATNVTLDGALTNDSSDSTDSNQSSTVYRQHSTDPLFEQSNLSQYANVDKTSNENTPHTLVEEMDLPTRPASPSDLNPTQKFMDISSDKDLLDTHVISPAMKNTLTSKAHQTSTATPIRKSNRRPKPRQIMNL